MRNITVHPKMKLNHRLVSAYIRHLRLSAPNRRPKTERRGKQSAIRPETPLIRPTIERDCFARHCRQLPNATNSMAVLDANDMASTLTNTL